MKYYTNILSHTATELQQKQNKQTPADYMNSIHRMILDEVEKMITFVRMLLQQQLHW